MKGLFIILTIIILNPHCVFSQKRSIELTNVKDTTAYSFYYIFPDKIPDQVKLPKTKLKYYSLSRSLQLPALKVEIPVLIGKTLTNEPVIVMDENFNHDLSDDPVIHFTDTLNGPGKGNYKHFEKMLSYKGKNIPLSFDFSIIKPKNLNLSSGEDVIENNIHLFIRPVHYKKAVTLFNDSLIEINVYTKKIFDFTRNSSFVVLRKNDSTKNYAISNLQGNKYVVNDIIPIGTEKYKFKSFSQLADSILLEKVVGNDPLYGHMVGYYLPELSGKDAISGKERKISREDKKYLLLDFWGTWCGPCLQLLPDLKKMNAGLNQDMVSMLGICMDNDEDEVRKFIKENQIYWPQIFEKKAPSGIVDKLDVKEFPTFILADPDGKIVFRESGLTGHQRLQEYLKKLKK